MHIWRERIWPGHCGNQWKFLRKTKENKVELPWGGFINLIYEVYIQRNVSQDMPEMLFTTSVFTSAK